MFYTLPTQSEIAYFGVNTHLLFLLLCIESSILSILTLQFCYTPSFALLLILLCFNPSQALSGLRRRQWMWIFKLTCVLLKPRAPSVAQSKDARSSTHETQSLYHLLFKFSCPWISFLADKAGRARVGFYVISLMPEWGGSQWMPSFSIHRFITNNQHCSRFVIRKKTLGKFVSNQRRILLF